jgi:DNA repair protein RecN (Recombination protein N)
VRKTWRDLSAARKALATAEAAIADIRAEEEFLRHAVAEFDALDPQPGEEAALDSQRRQMQAAEKVREDVARAFQALSGDGAEGAMGDAMRWLEDASQQVDGLLDSPIDALGRAFAELGEAVQGVEGALDQLRFDPHELEVCEERLFAMRGLARKHSIVPDDLAKFGDDLRTRLKTLDQGEGDLADLTLAVREAEAAYDIAATALTEARVKAAAKLDKAVSAELAPLKMERAVFTTGVSLTDAGPEGCDEVAFTVATNPGAPAGPLGKIASGGELSRFLLALKVCLSQTQSGVTMIFDEIDRGVGGATADAVGRRLSALADGGQVLVVTHSPQVAALGAHHWRVEKQVKNNVTTSRGVPLDEGERVDEIARMVAGERITEEARAAAKSLLAAR